MTDSFLDHLGTRLRDAERDLVRDAADRRARRRRRRAFGASALIVPLVAASAWAASGLLPEGSDVPYPAGTPVSGKGVGTVVPGSARTLVTGVADPAGGPSWGLRTFRTSRGLVCLQVGREQDGKLGQLGRFGAFGNDGRFHELRAGVVESEFQCAPPDGAGVGFLTMHSDAQSASGGVLTCGGPGGPTCRDAERRVVNYGLLGPKATSITVRPAPGVRRTLRTQGAEGAYLVVGRRTRPPRTVLRSGRILSGGDSPSYSPGFTPASPVVTRVRYGAAATCVLAPLRFGRQRMFGLRGGCPDPPGFTPIPKPSAASVRARVVARALPDRNIRVRFVARRAVRDRLSGYNVLVVFPGGHSANGSTTDRDLAAGQTVVKDISMPPNRRPGRYEVIVSLATQAARPLPGPLELQSLRLRLRPRPGGGITGYERGVVVGRTTVVVR